MNDLLVINSQTVFAATDTGVFESADGGLSWTPRSAGLPARSVTSITGRTAQLFVSLNGAGVWRSRNGEPWEDVSEGIGDPRVFDVENHPTDPDILFSATADNGVFFSDNSGAGWIRAGSGLVAGTYTDIAFAPNNPDQVFAVNGLGGLFESTDGGRNWVLRLALNAGFRRVRFSPHAADTVFVTTTAGVFRRSPGAATFESITPLQGFVVLDFLVDPTDPDLLYAATRQGSVGRSVDGGLNWALSSTGLPSGLPLVLETVPASTPALLVGVNGTGVHRSTDQGATWTNSSQGFTGADVLSLVADPTRHGVLYASTDGGGLFKTTDGGDSWIESRQGFALSSAVALAVDPAEPAVIYAGSVDPFNSETGLAARTDDGGATWTTLLGGFPIFDIAVHPTDRQTVYFASDGGGIFSSQAGLLRSRDRGQTTSPLVGDDGILFGLDVTDIAIDHADPDNLFVAAVGNQPLVFRSTNEGATFPEAFQTPVVGDIEIDPNDSRRIYVGAQASNLSNGFILRSTDQGSSFASASTGLPSTEFLTFGSVEVDPRDGAIYAAGGRAVYKSVDGGDSWQEANTGLEDVIVRRLALDGTDAGVVYAATVDRGVYRTLDGGATWAPTGTAALVISAQGVVGAADFIGGGVSPGQIITVFGNGVGPAAGVTAALDPATGGLPLTLAGVRVLFDGEPAPLFFTNSGQINCQVPYEVAGRSVVRIRVEFGDGVSSQVLVPVRQSKPGVFRAILNQDASVNTPDNPAKRGDVVVLFVTGQGVTQPPAVTGQPGPLTAPFPVPVLAVKATVDGREAERLFAGLAPGFVGLLQINLRVPLQTAAGARSVGVMIGDEMGVQDALLHVAP